LTPIEFWHGKTLRGVKAEFMADVAARLANRVQLTTD